MYSKAWQRLGMYPRNAQTWANGQAPIRGPTIHAQVGQPPLVPTLVQIALELVLAIDGQLSYEQFEKIKPPMFQGGQGEDV